MIVYQLVANGRLPGESDIGYLMSKKVFLSRARAEAYKEEFTLKCVTR